MITEKSINWPEIRAACITIGVRETARQASKDLPADEAKRFEERVMKRCSREGWLTKAQSLTVEKTAARPLSANVRNGSNAIGSHMLAMQGKSKTNLAKYVVNASKVAAKSRSPLEIAGKVRDAASVMEKVWPEEKEQVNSPLNLNVLCGNAAIQVVNPDSTGS